MLKSLARYQLLHLSVFTLVGLLVFAAGASQAGQPYRQPSCVTYHYQGLGQTNIVCDDASSYVFRDGDQGVGPRFEIFRPPSSGSRPEADNPKDKRRSRT
jgi:hypothetical protein